MTEHRSDTEILNEIVGRTEKLFSLFNRKGDPNWEYLFDILLSTNNYERQIIAHQYRYKYNREITADIEQNLNGNVKNAVKYLFYNPYELDAILIEKSLKKKDEKALVEIFATRPYWYLQVVNNEYNRVFGKPLKSILDAEKSDFYKFLVAIMTTPRHSSQTIKTQKEAADIASQIVKNGIKKYGQDIELFKEIFVKKSREDFILIARVFKTLDRKKRHLYDAVDSDCPSKTREILKAIVYGVSLPSHYFAHLLKKSIVGAGTDETTLTRVLVTRFEIDMEFIRSYYKLETKRELLEDIAGDTSGPYKELTMRLADKTYT